MAADGDLGTGILGHFPWKPCCCCTVLLAALAMRKLYITVSRKHFLKVLPGIRIQALNYDTGSTSDKTVRFENRDILLSQDLPASGPNFGDKIPQILFTKTEQH